jgi:hypothetical protein
MVVYTCQTCFKSFGLKADFTRHTNRKIKCEAPIKLKDDLIEQLEKEKTYQEEISKLRVLLQTKEEEKIIIIEEKDIILEEKNKEIQRLNDLLEAKNKEIQTLLKKTSRKNVTINQTNNVDNVVVNINMASFGSETCSKLIRNEKLSVLSSGDGCVVSMIRYIHDNDRLPEYRNVCVTNMRSSGGYVYENNGWKFNSHEDIIYMLLNARMSDLQDLIRDEDVTQEIRNIQRVKHIVDDYWGDSDRFIKEHKQKIIGALYNYTKNNMSRYKEYIDIPA